MQWTIDTMHSTVEFSVKHLGISTVRGRFREFSGAVSLDAAGDLRGFEATIAAASIETGVAQRDTHLRSPDFFDTERHPDLRFTSSHVERLAAGRYRVTGNLGMHGVTKPVVLEVETSGIVSDPWGGKRVAGTAAAVINRKDWGLTWNQVLELGAMVVGEDVKIALEIEAVAPAGVEAEAVTA